MKLPPEIRLICYEFAVHEYISTVLSDTLAAGCYMPQRPNRPYLGAPALIHTTSLIRKESRNAMLAIAHREWEVLCTRYRSLCEAYIESHLDSDLRRYLTASRLWGELNNLCFALDEEYISSYWVPKPKAC